MISTILQFKRVRKMLAQIPSISQDGCGVAALAMYSWLKKHDPSRKIKIIFLYSPYNSNSYRNNCLILKGELTNTPEAPSHCGIIFRNKLIDCKGKIDLSSMANKHEVTYDFLNQAVKNGRDWNTDFDRGYIRIINKELNLNI